MSLFLPAVVRTLVRYGRRYSTGYVYQLLIDMILTKSLVFLLKRIIVRSYLAECAFRQFQIFHMRKWMNRIALFAYPQTPIIVFGRW